MWGRGPLSALGAAAILGLAGCVGGSADDSEGIAVEDLDDVDDAYDPERRGPVTIEGAEAGGTIRVRDQFLLTTTVDPSGAYSPDSRSLLSGLVVRSLTQYAYDPRSNRMVLVPDLATSLGTPNDDYTVWEFTLRDGVRYENGAPVEAEDVGFAIDRSFDRTAFPTGAPYSNAYFLNGDTYKGPYTDKLMKSCECYEIDGNTITIRMSRPFPDMPHWAAFPAMTAIPRNASDPAVYRLHPLATGPYKFEQYTPAKSLTLVRNDRWDPATDPARTQYPDGYDFRTHVSQRWIDRHILSDVGRAQTALTRGDVLPQDYRTFATEAPERLILGGSPCTHYLAPDYRRITDIQIRRALGYAYPYETVNMATGYIVGVTALPADNLIPPGVPGRDEYDPEPDLDGFETDTARAKEILLESGHLGYEIKFFWRTDNLADTQVKDLTLKSLTEAGFKATPVPVTEAEYARARDDVRSDVNLRVTGWCSDWNSGFSWIPPVLETTDLEEQGFGANLSAFSEKDVDHRINEILEMPLEEQAAAWSELDRYITETYYPVITTRYTGVAQAHGSRVGGHFVDSVVGHPTWKTIHVIPRP